MSQVRDRRSLWTRGSVGLLGLLALLGAGLTGCSLGPKPDDPLEGDTGAAPGDDAGFAVDSATPSTDTSVVDTSPPRTDSGGDAIAGDSGSADTGSDTSTDGGADALPDAHDADADAPGDAPGDAAGDVGVDAEVGGDADVLSDAPSDG